jgi:hypothetical protein
VHSCKCTCVHTCVCTRVWSHLLCDVEGAAIGLWVEPAAAEGLSQDGIVGLLDPLQGAEASEEPGGKGLLCVRGGVQTTGQ